MKILIAGGSGYVGRHLADSLRDHRHETLILTRSLRHAANPVLRALSWDPRTPHGPWVSELNHSDAVVNLAGASIGGGRWTRRRMAEILASRLAATSTIVEAIAQLPREARPSVLVSASGIDFYGNSGDEPVDENSPPGDSFLATVCQQWEAAARKATLLGMRVVTLRTATVFGRGAPAFRLLTLPFRLFVGGPLGSGRQWFTWIHVDDLVDLYRFALENGDVDGPLNAAAPDVRRQREVAAEIGRALHRPSLIRAPAPLLRLALGRQADLLLDGRNTGPARAQALGYRFQFGSLPSALEDTLRRRRAR